MILYFQLDVTDFIDFTEVGNLKIIEYINWIIF